MKSTRISLVQVTWTIGDAPSCAFRRSSVAPISPMSWPASSTVETWTVPPWSSIRPDSMKLVEISLTIDNAGVRVDSPEPPMRTAQRVGSHDGGETS